MNSLPPGYSFAELFDDFGESTYAFDSEAADIARQSGMGITSDRELHYAILAPDESVVGAAWCAWDGDNYEFDLAISPAAKGAQLGGVLLDLMYQIPEEYVEQTPDATAIQRVINPIMQQMLLHKGYKVTRTLSHDDVFMEPVKTLLPILLTLHANETALFSHVVDDGVAATDINQEQYTQNPGLKSGLPKIVSGEVLEHVRAQALRFSEACGNHNAGFHFEEGGCWGFAGALYDRLHDTEIPAQLVYTKGAVHCSVKVNNQLFDHQGEQYTGDAGLYVICRDELETFAGKHGVQTEDLLNDIAWATEIIDDAYECDKNSPPEREPSVAHRLSR
jgi:hypothetical protein